MIEIEAKYPTKCRECSVEIAKGVTAMFDADGEPKRKMVCMRCAKPGDDGKRTERTETEAERLARELREATTDKGDDAVPGTPGRDLKTGDVTGDGDAYLAEYRVRLERIAVIDGFEGQYLSAEDAEPICRHMIGDADREHLIAVALGPDARPVGVHTVSIGTLDMTVGAPREAFKFLVVVGAHRFVLAHNHPSPDTTPSSADYKATARMQDVGKLAGIPLVASLIIGRDGNWCDILDQMRDREGYKWDDVPDDADYGDDPGDSDDDGTPDDRGDDGDDGEPGDDSDADGKGAGEGNPDGEPDKGNGPGEPGEGEGDDAPGPDAGDDTDGTPDDAPGDDGKEHTTGDADATTIAKHELDALKRFVEG